MPIYYVPTVTEQGAFLKIKEAFFTFLGIDRLWLTNYTEQERREFFFYCGWIRALAWMKGESMSKEPKMVCPYTPDCQLCGACGRCQYHSQGCMTHE